MQARSTRQQHEAQLQLAFNQGSRRSTDGPRGFASVSVQTIAEEHDAVLLDVSQVAALLGCGRTYVFELLASGQLPMVKLGRLTRVPRSALHEFVGQRTIRAMTDPGGRR